MAKTSFKNCKFKYLSLLEKKTFISCNQSYIQIAQKSVKSSGTSKQKFCNIQFYSEISHKEQKYPVTSEIPRQSPRHKAKLGRRNVFF